MTPRRAGAVMACVLALLAGTGAASDAGGDGATAAPGTPLDIDALLGFAGTFRPGRWTPLTVTVGNRGDAVRGHLEVETHDGDEFRRALYPVVHRRALALGRDARRRFHFTVHLASLSRPVAIRVVAGDRVLARETLDLRHRFTTSRLLLVVSRDADLDYLNAPGEDGVRVLYPHPGQLPRRWQGYDAVSAVVLHGLSLESLDADQYDALTRWIARGGTLAVSGGPDYALLSTPRLATLLPATPRGLVAVSDSVATGAALGAALTAPGVFHVNRVSGIRGEVLHQVDEVPLVLASRHGDGRVLYLTFDVARYPFDRWIAMRDVWARLLALDDAPPAPVHRDDAATLVPVLLQTQVPGFPGHGTLLLFLTLYLCVLATGYRIRRASPPGPRWLSPAALLVPAVFAPAAFALFNVLLFQPGTRAALLAVVEPLPASRHAALQLDLGVHTNRQDALWLAFERGAPVFRVPADERRHVDPSGWRVGHDRIAPATAGAYVLHLLDGQDTIVFEVEAALGDAARLAVRNDSGQAIEDAWVVYRGAAWHLGTLDADAPATFDLAAAPDVIANDAQQWWPALGRDPRVDPQRLRILGAVLERQLDRHGEAGYPGAGHALLLGFTEAPLRLAGPAAGWQRSEVGVVLLRFPAWLPGSEPADETNETT